MKFVLFATMVPAVLAQSAVPDQCAATRLTPLIATMTTSCQSLLGGALSAGTSVPDAEYCPCLLQLPQSTAQSLTCRALATDDDSIYASYQRCQARPYRWQWLFTWDFTFGFRWLGTGWGWGWGFPGWGWSWSQ